MKRIVVYDKDDDILNVVYIVLKQYGYIPLVTKQSDDIIDLVKKEKPHAIILDISKEPAKYKKLCSSLKSDPDHKDICIILFSTFREQVSDHHEYYAKGHILKPFDVRDLLKEIKRCL